MDMGLSLMVTAALACFHFFFLNISQYHLFCLRPDLQSSVWTCDFLWPQSLLVFSLLSLVNVMRCSVCHQDYKQSDIIDNYFVKDTTEATSTSDEKAAQVCRHGWFVFGPVLEDFCLLFGKISTEVEIFNFFKIISKRIQSFLLWTYKNWKLHHAHTVTLTQVSW